MSDKVKLRAFKSSCVVGKAGRDANLSWVLRRGLPLVKQIPERKDQLAIVCSGPSVRVYIDELREWPGQLWAINGAYRYLLDLGIIADGFFGMDPLPGLAPYVEISNPKTTFYISSLCDPAVFENLKDRNVIAWHPDGDGMEYPAHHWRIGGGTTAVTRAPFLALLQGYRDITLYGVDSSFDKGEAYCYRHGTYECDIDNVKLWVSANGEGPFETELGLMKQVSQLNIMQQKFNGMLKFRCGGLLEAFMRSPQVSEELFEMDDEQDAA